MRKWSTIVPAVVLMTALPHPARADRSRATLVIRAWPSGARATVEVRSDTEVLRGRTPWRRRVPPGRVEVKVTLKRHRPWSRRLQLDPGSRREIFACLDPEDQLVHCRHIVPVGLRPKAVLIPPGSREVWVALLISTPSIRVIDLESGARLATIRLGKKGATELEASADGTKIYASQMATAQVYEIDRKTRKVLRVFKTRGAWTKVLTLSADRRRLFASNWVSNDVSEIDLETGRLLRRLRTVKWPRGMYATPDGKHLYVAGFKHGELHKIDLRSGKGRVIFDRVRKMRHIVADEQKKRLYISDLGGNRIYVLDLASDKASSFVRTNRDPNTIALGPAGRVLYVSNRGRSNPQSYLLPGPEWGSVLLFDTGSRKILDAIVGGNQPTGLDVSQDGRVLVFSDFLDNQIRIYEVPPYDKLAAGGGGRAKSHLRDLPKKRAPALQTTTERRTGL